MKSGARIVIVTAGNFWAMEGKAGRDSKDDLGGRNHHENSYAVNSGVHNACAGVCVSRIGGKRGVYDHGWNNRRREQSGFQ